MAKALIGHLRTDQRSTPALARENARLKVRVAELESLVLRLQRENDALAEAASADLEPMLPA